MKNIIETLHELNDIDNTIKDIENPEYQKFGFKVEDRITELLRTRKELLAKLPKELAENYERLRKRYTAVFAGMKNGFCFGCFQQLPTEMITKIVRLKEMKEIIYCPNCGKVLYMFKE